ncbi:MAG: cereblon family protein [Desulfobacterales bacterium]|nr:cereblon family protein [Desulfobacterales bacterium]
MSVFLDPAPYPVGDLVSKSEPVCKKAEGRTKVTSDTLVDEKEEPVVRCRTCNHTVAKSESRISIEQKFAHTFANPAGHVFEIGCFRQAEGCVAASPPSDEFSWFRGYAWRVGICRHCQVQLGWVFSSVTDANPPRFFGLILDQLILP